MESYDPATYGERIADIYDDLYERMSDVETTVATLAELAAGGSALELGIGTGRIAVPLAARGVTVHGIDSSAAMVERLKARPGGATIPISIGDFAEVRVEGRFSLVYVVFNTFFGLPSQEAQIRCFASVAHHLEPGGAFVIEAFVPDPARFAGGQNTQTSRVEVDRVIIDLSRHDPVDQRVVTQHVLIEPSGVRLCPVQIRYAWPSELDLMARLAGLRLHARWEGWHRQPFTARSPSHVSVYRPGP
ncbi:MAG: class I SAM-dependent methyltransferase [Candidatus Riflebacteria bacterium]|nr:class I SAM-dependent methyltransferase [Candidatus Riflebacteria bacterium]